MDFLNDLLYVPQLVEYFKSATSIVVVSLFVISLVTLITRHEYYRYMIMIIMGIYGIYFLYPKLVEKTSNVTIDYFYTETRNIGITHLDISILIGGILVLLVLSISMRSIIPKIYRVYVGPYYRWKIVIQKIVDFVYFGVNNFKILQKPKKIDGAGLSALIEKVSYLGKFVLYWIVQKMPSNLPGHSNKDQAMPKLWQLAGGSLFYPVTALYLYHELYTRIEFGGYRLHNLSWLLVGVFVWIILYEILGKIMFSNLANRAKWLGKLYPRYHKSEDLTRLVRIYSERETRNVSDPVYTPIVKICCALGAVLITWFLYKLWGLIPDYDRLAQLITTGDSGGKWFIIAWCIRILKVLFVVYVGIIILPRYTIPDIRSDDGVYKSFVVGPFQVWKNNSITGMTFWWLLSSVFHISDRNKLERLIPGSKYEVYIHPNCSHTSIIAVFGMIIATFGLFYPYLFAVLLMLMAFRGYSSISLYKFSEPEKNESN